MRKILLTALLIAPGIAFAESVEVTMNSVDAKGVGNSIGTVTISETKEGLQFAPKLQGLPPGERGFHIHEKPDCTAGEKDGKVVAALGAGSHYDPSQAGKHEGPTGEGHKGDLPALTVADDGTATKAVTASRLTLADVKNRSLMIHAGGDNYSDSPEPLGGGGARIACGVIK